MRLGGGQGRSWRHFGLMLGTRGAQSEIFDDFRVHLGSILGAFWTLVWCFFAVFSRSLFERLFGDFLAVLGSISEAFANHLGLICGVGSPRNLDLGFGRCSERFEPPLPPRQARRPAPGGHFTKEICSWRYYWVLLGIVVHC